MKKELIAVTPAQKELFILLKNPEVEEYYNALKKVHYLATYSVDVELIELSASAYVHELMDVVQKIVIEHCGN
jgi:hypothetical protein